MNEDQIKAIAEKFNKEYYTPIGWNDLITFLRFLNKRYCIVEREKVIEMYSSLKTPDYPCVDPKPTGVARIVMCNLFGTSMFNQDEE